MTSTVSHTIAQQDIVRRQYLAQLGIVVYESRIILPNAKASAFALPEDSYVADNYVIDSSDLNNTDKNVDAQNTGINHRDSQSVGTQRQHASQHIKASINAITADSKTSAMPSSQVVAESSAQLTNKQTKDAIQFCFAFMLSEQGTLVVDAVPYLKPFDAAQHRFVQAMLMALNEKMLNQPAQLLRWPIKVNDSQIRIETGIDAAKQTLQGCLMSLQKKQNIQRIIVLGEPAEPFFSANGEHTISTLLPNINEAVCIDVTTRMAITDARHKKTIWQAIKHWRAA